LGGHDRFGGGFVTSYIRMTHMKLTISQLRKFLHEEVVRLIEDAENEIGIPFDMSISNLVGHRESLFDAYEHCVYRNKWSRTPEPLVVVPIEGEIGKYQLVDGYHRLIEYLLDGMKRVSVVVGGAGSREYSIARGGERWEGDESKTYGNLEDLTDKKTLKSHALKRKNLKKTIV